MEITGRPCSSQVPSAILSLEERVSAYCSSKDRYRFCQPVYQKFRNKFTENILMLSKIKIMNEGQGR
jgi:hypothetical protein